MEEHEIEQVMEMLKTMMAKREANRKANHEEMMAMIKAWGKALDAWPTDIKNDRKETMACQGNMEAHLEEDKPASVETTPEVADDQEVPVEDAVEMPAGEPRKRRRDRHLAAVRRQKKKDRVLDARCRGREQGQAQRKNGCPKNLVAARRGRTCCAGVARRILFTKTTRSRLIVAVREVPHRATVARRNILPRKDTTRKHRESRKKLAATGRKETRRAKVVRQKRNFVGRNQRKEFATGRNHAEHKVERGTQGIWALKKRFWTRQMGRAGPEDLSGGPYVASRNIKCWTLWRGRPPPKRKK
jgi:hypothetical protein